MDAARRHFRWPPPTHVPFERVEVLELMLHQEGEQLAPQAFDLVVALFHPPCATRDVIAPERDEVGGGAPGLDPANGGQTFPGKFAPDHGRNFHDHPERDWPDRFARITARRRESFDARFRPQGVEVPAHHAADRGNRAYAVTAPARS